MESHLQVKAFDNVISGNTTEQCNIFLKEMGIKVTSVTPLYNTILGGVVYIVTYFKET